MVAANSATSTLIRAEVKAETLRARADGQLVPAGEDVAGADLVRTARVAPRNGGKPFTQLLRPATPAGQ